MSPIATLPQKDPKEKLGVYRLWHTEKVASTPRSERRPHHSPRYLRRGMRLSGNLAESDELPGPFKRERIIGSLIGATAGCGCFTNRGEIRRGAEGSNVSPRGNLRGAWRGRLGRARGSPYQGTLPRAAIRCAHAGLGALRWPARCGRSQPRSPQGHVIVSRPAITTRIPRSGAGRAIGGRKMRVRGDWRKANSSDGRLLVQS
jgi:hypothetical protein